MRGETRHPACNGEASGNNEAVSRKHDPVIQQPSPTPPFRVWSLIVTIFGDIVMDRGTRAEPEPVWIAPLLELLALLGVDAAAARTNFSRLVANGTLLRDKAGRNTFYRLSPESRDDFRKAASIIYGHDLPRHTGAFRLALIDRARDRAAARERLARAGFRFITPGAAIAPEREAERPLSLPDDVIPAMAAPSQALAEAAREAWQLATLAENYRWFVTEFADLARMDAASDPAAAMARRVLLVHHFRRLILRDPLLTEDNLPVDWPGTEARRLFDTGIERLAEASAIWQRAHGLAT